MTYNVLSVTLSNQPTNLIQFDDMSCVKLWTSPQLISIHFSQSRRQTSDVTFADKRMAQIWFTTLTDELKRR